LLHDGFRNKISDFVHEIVIKGVENCGYNADIIRFPFDDDRISFQTTIKEE